MFDSARYRRPRPAGSAPRARTSVVVRWATVTIAVAALMLGCRDSTLAPDGKASLNKVTIIGQATSWESGWSTDGSTAGATDTTVSIMTVNPLSRATFNIGEHKLFFPPGSVCDPSRSSYGAGEWDQPCTPISSPITITAKTWTNAEGHPQIAFSPALRFVPAVEPWRAVMLYLKDKSVTAAMYNILWCDDAGACVDESLTDPTVATFDDLSNGFLYRRIKHFSGYNVAARYGSVEEF